MTAVAPAHPSRLVATAAVAGPGAVLVLVAWTLMAWAAGATPWWPVPVLTLPEAAAVRDTAEVLRLVRAGADPNAEAPVRAGLLGARPVVVRPVEAAVRIGRGDVLALLLAHGAVVPEGVWRDELICFSERVGADEVLPVLLATGDGTDPRPDRYVAPGASS